METLMGTHGRDLGNHFETQLFLQRQALGPTHVARNLTGQPDVPRLCDQNVLSHVWTEDRTPDSQSTEGFGDMTA